jgi:hypothetical protein
MPGAPEIRSLSGWSGFIRKRSAFRKSNSATLPAWATREFVNAWLEPYLLGVSDV